MATISGSSCRRVCRILEVSRTACGITITRRDRRPPVIDAGLEELVKRLIERHPSYGYRRIWALVRFHEGIKVNRKRIYRLFKLRGMFVHTRRSTPRPRVKGKRSRSQRSNERWATDVTHVFCGQDGWAHFVGVIDCHDRELIGHEFALRGRAREAERALEEACFSRFGHLRLHESGVVLRSDNGLVFQSRRFRSTCRAYGITQEYITPYTPQQNGIIERFFRSLKEECVWQRSFKSFAEARRIITEWVTWYNSKRPHQELAYRSPREFRAQKSQRVA
jgi:putative transposase